MISVVSTTLVILFQFLLPGGVVAAIIGVVVEVVDCVVVIGGVVEVPSAVQIENLFNTIFELNIIQILINVYNVLNHT